MIHVLDIKKHLPEECYNWPEFKDGEGSLYIPDDCYPVHRSSVKRAILSESARIAYWPQCEEMVLTGIPRLRPAFFLSRLDSPEELKCRVLLEREERKSLIKKGDLLLNRAPVEGFTCLTEMSEQEKIFYYVENPFFSTAPMHIIPITGNKCNLSCSMCFFQGKKFQALHKTDFYKTPKLMSPDLMNKIAVQAGDITAAIEIGSVEEPLLNPSTVDMVGWCKNHGCTTVHITSNGTLLNDKTSERLLKNGLDSLSISLDAADEQSYRAIRGGELYMVEQKIESFLNMRERFNSSCTVELSIINNPLLKSDEFNLFLNKWGNKVRSIVKFSLVTLVNGERKLDFNPKVEALLKTKQLIGCGSPFSHLFITPDGDTFPCCKIADDLAFSDQFYSFGNINQSSIKDIWASTNHSLFCKNLLTDNPDNNFSCKNCYAVPFNKSIVETDGCWTIQHLLSASVWRKNTQ